MSCYRPPLLVHLYRIYIPLSLTHPILSPLSSFFQIHSIYRNTGASVEKARTEFADRFMSNQHVQQAASNAATAVINSQLSGGNNGSGPRY